LALKKCKECGTEISTKAQSCPKCGAVIKKKTGCLGYIFAGFLILCVFVVIGSLTDSGKNKPNSSNISGNTPSQTQQVHKEGDTVNIGYTSYVAWRSWWSSQLSDNEFLNNKPDAMYLFIEITVRNDDKKARTIPPFILIDENGAEHETTSKSYAVDGSIGMLDDLNPGVKKQGFIIFDVPPGHTYKLKVSGGYWSTEDALIELAPKQSNISG
jgi:hypothetical protein